MIKKLAIVLFVVLFAQVAKAEMSERCIIVISQSAAAFTKIDAYRNGLSASEVDAELQSVFMEAEIEAMREIYNVGVEAAQSGHTRKESLSDIIKAVNAANSENDLPAGMKREAAKASINAFMCGFDDQTKSL